MKKSQMSAFAAREREREAQRMERERMESMFLTGMVVFCLTLSATLLVYIVSEL